MKSEQIPLDLFGDTVSKPYLVESVDENICRNGCPMHITDFLSFNLWLEYHYPKLKRVGGDKNNKVVEIWEYEKGMNRVIIKEIEKPDGGVYYRVSYDIKKIGEIYGGGCEFTTVKELMEILDKCNWA